MMDGSGGIGLADNACRILEMRDTGLSRVGAQVTTFAHGKRILTFHGHDLGASLDIKMHLSRADIVALRDALDASLALDAPAQADAMLRARAGKSGEAGGVISVIDEIAAERRRQVEVEGWTAEHDDQHRGGGMAVAAACYIEAGAGTPLYHPGVPPVRWPWGTRWWKPKTRRHDLIRAAALLVAEIERLDRAAATGEAE